MNVVIDAPGTGARAVQRCDQLGVAPYSEEPDRLTRRYLSAAHAATLECVAAWMREAQMTTRIDAVGNLIGRYEGEQPGAPALLLGSHLDSVPNGGRYDGPLGVMIGIECVARLARGCTRLPFAVEVIGFGDEEGSRFPASMLCSRALLGDIQVDPQALRDRQGISWADALREFGLSPERLPEAHRRPGEILAYIEAHIEQGPVLEAEGHALGVVTGISGQLRLRATFTGEPGHAGTYPMHLRRDALAAAAEAILVVERLCAVKDSGVVGTVGHVRTSTSAYNVIVGEADIFIDLRSGDRVVRDQMAERIRQALATLAATRKVRLSLTTVQDLAPTACDARLIELMAQAASERGQRAPRLASGAGHDAMVLAALAPMAMLFIRCARGISHSPEERVAVADVECAIGALHRFVDRLAEQTMKVIA